MPDRVSELERYEALRDDGYVLMSLIVEGYDGAAPPTQEQMTAHAEEGGFHNPLAFDPDADPHPRAWTQYDEALGLGAFPAYLVFDRDQKLRDWTIGHDPEWIGEVIDEQMARD